MRDPDIERKLVQWASWVERQGAGAGRLGFARTGFEPAARGGYREAAIPIDEFEAAITDSAVLALESPLRAAVEAYYLREACYDGRGSIGAAAARLVIGQSTLHKRISDAHQALSRWFGERHRAQAEQQARLHALQQTARPKDIDITGKRPARSRAARVKG